MVTIKFNFETKTYELVKYMEVFKVEGNVNQVTEIALEEGLDREELIRAYNTMAENKHSEAQFDLNGRYLYSK